MTLRILFISFLFFLMGHSSMAQVHPGIKFGISTSEVDPQELLITDNNGEDYYRILVTDARYGLHGGAFFQIQMGGFFIQPEILYNSTKVEYAIDSLLSPGSTQDVFKDSYRNIDFPLMIGLKSGPVRLGGGPVAHLYLESQSGFKKYEPDFKSFPDKLTWGWQAGMGLDLWKLHVDVRYEGKFTDLGDYLTFFGKKFEFATNNNRLIASLGFSF